MADHWSLIRAELLEAAESRPVHRRIQIYRAIAHHCGDEAEATAFQTAARELEEADARCRELALRFEPRRN